MLEFYQDFYLLEENDTTFTDETTSSGIQLQLSTRPAVQENDAAPEENQKQSEEETVAVTEQPVPPALPAQNSSTRPAVQENDAAPEENQEQPETETIAVTEQPAPPAQNSSTGAYIVGGIGCGVAVIAAALCAVLFKKSANMNHTLQQKKTELDSASQQVQQLQNQLSEMQSSQQSVQDTLHALQKNDENLMDEINSIRLEPMQSADTSEEITKLIQKIRQQQESLEYHDSVLRKLQAAQETFQQNTEAFSQQHAGLSAAVTALQTSLQQQKQHKSVPEVSTAAPVSAHTSEIPLSFDEMLDVLDQQYNQAVFLSISSGMGMQPSFYEDTERKAHVILIQDKCYPNPYRFVNLEKQQETYSHLSVLAPVFDLRNIADGNGKYGLDGVLPATLELQEDGSHTLHKKGVLSFC